MTYPLVSVVVSNYNGLKLKLLGECLDSLVKSSYPNVEILLVDNLSSDDSVEFVKRKYSTIRIVQNSVNNYSMGLNKGIHESSGKYIFFVSNDIAVRSDCLSELVNAMEMNPLLVIAQPKLLSYSNLRLIDCVGGTMDFYGNPVEIGRNNTNNPNEYGVRETLSVEATYIVRRSVLNEIGIFDDKFVIGYEDADLALRSRLRGYKVGVVLQAVATHRRGVSSITPDVLVEIKGHFYKNRIATIIKNYELGNVLTAIPGTLLVYFLIMASDLTRKYASLVIERMRSLLWLLTHLRYILIQRNHIQINIRRVPDDDLKHLFASNQLIVMLAEYSRIRKSRR